MDTAIADAVNRCSAREPDRKRFMKRIRQGKLTRSENPVSHLCVYFAAYDPADRAVFIGLHKKSGLWLANGGHLDAGETLPDAVIREAREEWGIALSRDAVPSPSLATVTEIEHPERQVCEWHYDVWHFLPRDRFLFRPDASRLATEFFDSGWYGYDEASLLVTDPASRQALAFLKKLPASV